MVPTRGRGMDSQDFLLLIAAAVFPSGEKGGDSGAFGADIREALWEQHRYLLAMLKCKTRNDDEAEDILQETYLAFLRAVQKPSGPSASSFRNPTKLRNYLISISLNKLRDRYRGKDSSKRRLEFRSREEAEAWLDGLPSPEPGQDQILADAEEDRERRDTAALAMEGLSGEHRRVLELKFVRGLGNPEAAAEMGLGVKALESLLFRAKAAFKKAFLKTIAAANDGRGKAVDVGGEEGDADEAR
jgi:RNA polymerase sigma factor (sigma-70 family)